MPEESANGLTVRQWLGVELALAGTVLSLEGLHFALTGEFAVAPSFWPGLALEGLAVVAAHNMLWLASMAVGIAGRRLGGEAE